MSWRGVQGQIAGFTQKAEAAGITSEPVERGVRRRAGRASGRLRIVACAGRSGA